VPVPATAYHCLECGHCVLRFDHHCGVVGACIADKNRKSFVQALVYVFFFGAATALCAFLCVRFGALDPGRRMLCLVCGIYSSIFALIMPFVGVSFLWGNGREPAFPGQKKLKWKKLWQSFGDSWWERIIPIQRRSTPLAWPGVCWDEDFTLM
jgi:hypothetical protein